MQENIKSLSLYLNSVLEILAIYLAKNFFHDFKFADKIFSLDSLFEKEYELVLGSSITDQHKSFFNKIKNT